MQIKSSASSHFFSPMLARLYPKPFNGKNWLFEIKYDGYRTLAIIEKNRVELFSRNHISFNKLLKPVADDLKKIKHDAALDGEAVIEDERGRPHFQLLQNYQKTGKGILKYYVFDILFLNGKDTRNLPLLARKELVKTLMSKYKFVHIFYADHIAEKGKEFYELAAKNKLEGIVAKKADSPYRSGKRSKEWLKIKITNSEEAVIAGITEPQGGRKYFGSLLLGQYENKKFRYAGNCGTGFSYETLKDLYGKFKPYFTHHSPFEKQIKAFGKIQWLKPKFVCEVKFSEKTFEGIYRHPVFIGLRLDKEAKDVHPEKPITGKIK